MFQSQISRAYHGKGEATESSDSAGSQLDRQPIQSQDTEIPEYLCTPGEEGWGPCPRTK
jgi:hypothetical protein